MHVVCRGNCAHVFTDPGDWNGVWAVDYTWEISICAVCDGSNIFLFTELHGDVVPVGYDSLGNPIDEQQVTTTILYPKIDETLPRPHKDMPEDIRVDYEEARSVFSVSPRSSAALLRLVIQKLCKVYGGKGSNINDDIKLLVANGLPEKIQKALDIVRIIGNESVHPGQIDVKDDSHMARDLFEIVNEIVDDRVTYQKIINLYSSLPESKRLEIQKRDQKNRLDGS
jgi:Domain of unknown function (DUF4145)